ncbi:MAG: hypothetical protein RIB52_04800 [Erythrobacter sp.]|uniref:hypothetical protein n=1 Tax=Erythrobacter sp. TaxID=1042 RepID=UPI0032EF139C
MIALHSLALGFALIVALACPRPGAPALLVPLGAGGMGAGMDDAIAWVEREDARFLALDTASAQVIARVPDHASLLRALAAGIVPVAADATGCIQPENGEESWKN